MTGKDRAKRELRELRTARDRLRKAREDMETAAADYYGIRGSRMGGTGTGGRAEDAIAGSLYRLEEARRRYEEARRECEAKTEEALRRIKGIEKKSHSDVLRWRYLDGEKWEEIGERLGVSLQRAHVIHAEALGEYAKQMPQK